MERTRGPVFVLGLVGAIVLGAVLAHWLERDTAERAPGADEQERTAASELRAPGGAEDEREAPSAREAVPRAEGGANAATALPEGVLAGRVLDAGGRPLAGATVALTRGEAREFTVLDPAARAEAVPMGEQLSDADGRFRFTLALGLPLDVTAVLEGYSAALVTNAYAGQELELVLTPGVLVHGTVTRARDGAPVDAAEVRVFQLGGPATLERRTRTRADGGYELRIPFRSDARLEIVPVLEQGTDWLALDIGADERCQKDVVLGDGYPVSGRVSDAATGQPLAGAIVGEGAWFRRTATTDARGEYRLEGFGAPGVREVHVRASGYGAARREAPAPVDGVARLDFALQRGRAVSGRVVDDGGAPLAGAYVAAVASEFDDGGQQRTDWLSTRSDADGRYRLSDLAADLGHALFVSRHGYGTQVHDFPEGERETPELSLPDIVLRRPALLAGRIEAPGGEPLAGIEVELEGWNHDRYRFTQRETARARFYVDRRTVQSDARGRFWFGDLAAGRYRLLTRSAGRPESAPLTIELTTGERREDVVLRLDAGSTLTGVVVAPDASPLAGVYVSAQSERLTDRAASAPGHVHVKTAADGRFEIAGLPAGEYTLRAYPLETPAADPDQPWLPATIEHVATGAQPLRIELARGAVIRGRCLDAAGAPLAGYVVGARNDQGASGEYAQTDRAGAFRLTVPRGTRWTLELHGAPQGETFAKVFATRRGVAAGTHDVELRLAP